MTWPSKAEFMAIKLRAYHLLYGHKGEEPDVANDVLMLLELVEALRRRRFRFESRKTGGRAPSDR